MAWAQNLMSSSGI